MATILQYKCSNKGCDFFFVIEQYLPIWKSDTPVEKRKLPVGWRNKGLVAGFVDSRYCLNCRAIQLFIQDSDTCLICKRDNPLNVEDLCPECLQGELKENEALRIQF